MAADNETLDRIDMRYAVRTKTVFERPEGPVTIEGSFLITLGTYSGITSAEIMARSINDRGIHPGDVDSVAADAGCPSIVQAVAMLAERGIREDDVVSMRIAAILLDDEEIAEAFERDAEESD